METNTLEARCTNTPGSLALSYHDKFGLTLHSRLENICRAILSEIPQFTNISPQDFTHDVIDPGQVGYRGGFSLMRVNGYFEKVH